MQATQNEYQLNINDYILPTFKAAKPLESNLEVKFYNDNKLVETFSHVQEDCKNLVFPYSRSQLLEAPIKRSKMLVDSINNERIGKDVMELALHIPESAESAVEWQPGDTIAVLASNSEEEIDELLHLLNLSDKADVICHFIVASHSKKKTAKVPMHIPSESTLRKILRDCVNIRGVLKKQFLSALSTCCTNSLEQSFLSCLSSTEATNYYNELILAQGLTVLDILRLCPTCVPPVSLIIEHLGRLMPRPYSIANSPLARPKEINIIFSIISSKPGVTTKMMSQRAKEENGSLKIYFREPNLFRYTEDNYYDNQILVAVGTGISPFLGFLEHKERLMANRSKESQGQTWLFIGALTNDHILYRNRLNEWQNKDVLNKCEYAISRSLQQPCKEYVQDTLLHHSEKLGKFLMLSKTTLYVCADGGVISKCIEKAIVDVVAQHLGLPEDDALNIIKQFKASGKYREDIWT